jgi:NAD(P)-dependent dehydrogenase (short-subunit alcohol dehydrogenase family)
MSKVWFVTGAGRGMGVDIAKAALAVGHEVVATGRNIDQTEERGRLSLTQQLGFQAFGRQARLATEGRPLGPLLRVEDRSEFLRSAPSPPRMDKRI